MTKKMMLFALAAISAAIFALPAVASAAEAPVVEPGGTAFSGTFGPSTLGAEGEPTITCEGENHVTGTFNGNATTPATGGTVSLDATNCHIVVLGITIKCKTEGAPLENTIALSNVPFDMTYATDNKTKPAVLATGVNVTVRCGSTSPIDIEGNVMGTVTAPACGGTSSSATLSAQATNNSQEHKQITGTGTLFDLTSKTTPSGTAKTAGVNATGTANLAEGKTATLTCV